MLVLLSQIFSIALAGIAFSKSYVDFRAGRESLRMFLLWTVTWSGIVVVALFPTIVDFLIAYLGSGSVGLGRFLGMALVFLFYLVYRVDAKLERLEQSIAELVREVALKGEWRPGTARKNW